MRVLQAHNCRRCSLKREGHIDELGCCHNEIESKKKEMRPHPEEINLKRFSRQEDITNKISRGKSAAGQPRQRARTSTSCLLSCCLTTLHSLITPEFAF